MLQEGEKDIVVIWKDPGGWGVGISHDVSGPSSNAFPA